MSEAARAIELQFYLNEQPPKVALEILKFHGLQYDFSKEEGILYVRTAQEWLQQQYGVTEPEEFVIQFADVTYVQELLVPFLSSKGRLVVDPRTARIYVWDTHDNLKHMAESVAKVDIPLEKRIFQIEYARLANIQTALSALLSPTGTVLADERTGQVTVWDLPYALTQIEEAVLELDVPLEKADFLIQHADLTDIEGVLNGMISPGGRVIADARTGQILVWDLPGAIDKMRAAVARLDVPVESRSFPHSASARPEPCRQHRAPPLGARRRAGRSAPQRPGGHRLAPPPRENRRNRRHPSTRNSRPAVGSSIMPTSISSPTNWTASSPKKPAKSL